MSKLTNKRRRMWEKSPFCFVCSKAIEDYKDCTLEHIVPKSMGGTNRCENLSISHSLCNNQRGNNTKEEDYNHLSPFLRENFELTSSLKGRLFKIAELMEKLNFDSEVIADIFSRAYEHETFLKWITEWARLNRQRRDVLTHPIK